MYFNKLVLAVVFFSDLGGRDWAKEETSIKIGCSPLIYQTNLKHQTFLKVPKLFILKSCISSCTFESGGHHIFWPPTF